MKTRIILAADQGWPGGLIGKYQGSIPGLRAALAAFEPRYDVAISLCPTHPDAAAVESAMRGCVAANLAFVVDVASSDVIALEITAEHAPYDIQHGISVPQGRLFTYEAACGAHFLGLRWHELSSMDMYVRTGKHAGLPWAQYASPSGKFISKEALLPFLWWAQAYKKTVLWEDPYWAAAQPEDYAAQHANEQMILGMMAEVPGVVVPMYANNMNGNRPAPGQPAGDRMAYYHGWLSPYLWPHAQQDAGWPCFGLNNEGWMYDGTNGTAVDMAGLCRWAVDLVQKGGRYMILEPLWLYYDIVANRPLPALTQMAQAVNAA